MAVLGFLVVTALNTGRVERQRSAPRKAELVELIEARSELVEDLDEAVGTLRREVAQAQGRASRDDSRTRLATNALATAAGTAPVRGAGIVVQLSPSDREPPSPEEAGAYQIHDSDLQLVVNALFAAGAEAVAINDSRYVATTPIRSAGGTIVVNFRPLSPPYKVEAIGVDRARFGASEIARRFERWTSLFGLGFSVRVADELALPGYTGRVGIAAARPVGGA